MDWSRVEQWWEEVDKRRLIETILVFLLTFGLTALVRWDLDFTYPVGRDQVDAGVYATIGDICVFVAVLMLGAPWGPAVAAIAMAAADLAVGSKLYIIGTLFIKFGMAYFIAVFALQCNTWKRCFVVAGLTETIMFVCYFFYDLIFVNYTVAAQALPVNMLQGLICAALGGVILMKLPAQRPRELPRIKRKAKLGRFDDIL